MGYKVTTGEYALGTFETQKGAVMAACEWAYNNASSPYIRIKEPLWVTDTELYVGWYDSESNDEGSSSFIIEEVK